MPVWKRVGGGCHLNRKIDDLITAAGFRIVELKTCYPPGPRSMTYTYQDSRREMLLVPRFSLRYLVPPEGLRIRATLRTLGCSGDQALCADGR